ncbi:cupin domain-containing protein [Phytoactinopolyspora limicola]|uniref:cupin domain-containing protein n=1 Tax=Phytoactinopolyspora limicola TaxID=2715536 RepID=UPI00140B0E35|nr:cupin domain-containing protein [Phytoactinopolyspora limicola]
MSYPAQRYFGHSGEVTARFRPGSAEPDYVTTPAAKGGPVVERGTSYHYLATTKSTDGDFGLYRVDMAAGAGGPAMHFHKTMSESFFILDGTLRLHDGSRWLDGEPGDFLYVPPGGLHAFRNESGEPVSMLMLFAPGAPREAYFEGITEIASLTDDERARFFIEHDSYFT